MMTFKICLAAILATVFIVGLPEAVAQTEIGKDYDRELISHNPDGTTIYQWSSHPERIVDYYDSNNLPVYRDYRLFEDSSIVQLETSNSGSLVFDKSTCSYNLYDPSYIGGSNTPKVKGISWTVKGKLASSSTWSNVNEINNAACSVSVQTTESTAKIIGEKTTSSGTFQIVLDYVPGRGIKETMRGYNNNPAWNNHNIGFTEKFEVPQIVHFGNKTYNLANYNNTVLDRDWLENNKAKLIKFNDLFYDFGIGFANLNDVKITWIGSKAYLSLNYLYPTQIVPYQTWFEVDPTFGPSDDTSYLLSSTVAAEAGCPAGVVTKTTATGRAEKNADVDAGGGCNRAIAAWDITSIPTTVTSVTDADAAFTSSSAVNMGAQTCDSFRVMNDPATASGNLLWNDAEDGSQYVTADTNCRTASTYSLDLGNQANTDIQATRAAGNSTFTISVKLTSEVRDGSGHSISFVNNAIDLTVIYTIPPPNPPTNFAATSQAKKVQFTWTASTPLSGSQNGVDAYFIGRSLDNVTFTNKTNTGNVTSYLHTGYWAVNRLYYLNITASDTGNTNSTASFTSMTTDNYPSVPLNPVASGQSDSSIIVRWAIPTSNGNDSISGYRIEYCITCTSWSQLVNNTNTVNYNQTGIVAGSVVTYRMAAWNGVGLSVFTANFTGRPFEATTGTVTLDNGIMGDVIQLNATVSITTASPSPVTVDRLQLYRNGTLIETKNVSVEIARGSSSSDFDPFWNQMTTDDNYSFKMYARVSNSTGTVNIGSTNTTTTREYNPFYFTAEDPTLGEVNHTESRSDDGDTVYLKVNRDRDGIIFPINCLYQTLFQALANDGEGVWSNATDVGYYNATVAVEAIPTIYITCYNPPNILFTTTLYSEENPLAAGIALFDAFGGILGAPSIILIVLAIFSLATGKNSPQVLVLALIVIGVLTSIGLIVFEGNIFPMILVAGAVGIFAMRRYYF